MSVSSKNSKTAAKRGSSKPAAKSTRTTKSGEELVPKKLHIVMENNRNQLLGGLAIRIVIAGLCLVKLGTIGQIIGAAVALSAIFKVLKVYQTVVNQPGTFQVSDSEIVVPTGLCSGQSLSLKDTQLQHAFFIRKAVPWTQAGPILVIEAEDKAYSFPRDWFASDSDQLRVARALHQRIASASVS